MENEKMGPFIRRLRKERGMTQKELANRLNVTDKAVSKWELGASLPDVALLLPLAETLGVSVTELLGGVREADVAPPPEAPPRDTAGDILSYTQKTAAQRREKLRRWLLAGLGGACLLAALVCWICDTALNGTLTWSLVVDLSLLLAWAVLLPLLALRRHGLEWALGTLSAASLPYLYLLGLLLEEPQVFRLGLPIAPAGALCLWAVWAVWRHLGRRKWRAAGAVVLLTGLLSLYSNAVVRALTGSGEVYGEVIFTLVLAAGCFLVDFLRGRGPDA